MFQSYHLLDNLTVYENLDIPLSYRNVSRKERESMVGDMLDRFQIVGKKDLYPNQLSGGQQQLVGVARAVIANPKVILADEPTGNLHSAQGKEIMELFRTLNEAGTTIVQVTHSEENASYGTRIIQLRDGWVVDEETRTNGRSRASKRGFARGDAYVAIAQRWPVATTRRCEPTSAPRILDRRRPARRARGAAPAAQGRGLPHRVRRLAGRRSSPRSTRDEFDAVLMDLNYTRDTTSGQEGLDLLSQLQRARSDAAGGRDDGVGQRRGRGRGDAPRRARLRPEAVGQRAAADDRPHAGRARPRAAHGQQRLEAENRSLRADGRAAR